MMSYVSICHLYMPELFFNWAPNYHYLHINNYYRLWFV